MLVNCSWNPRVYNTMHGITSVQGQSQTRHKPTHAAWCGSVSRTKSASGQRGVALTACRHDVSSLREVLHFARGRNAELATLD
eukprot:6252027-Alexandrium_andersonii.AAC.1